MSLIDKLGNNLCFENEPYAVLCTKGKKPNGYRL